MICLDCSKTSTTYTAGTKIALYRATFTTVNEDDDDNDVTSPKRHFAPPSGNARLSRTTNYNTLHNCIIDSILHRQWFVSVLAMLPHRRPIDGRWSSALGEGKKQRRRRRQVIDRATSSSMAETTTTSSTSFSSSS